MLTAWYPFAPILYSDFKDMPFAHVSAENIMKNISSILVLVALLGLATPARAETVVLAADEWCPYNCEAGSDKPGFMVEIARAALGKHGIAVEYVTVPWARAIEETRQNKYAGIIGAYYGDAEDFVYPKVPQGRSAMTFYAKKDSAWNYKTNADLEGISLGIIADYSYSTELDDYIEQHKADAKRIQVVSGDDALEANIQKVIHGRIGAFVEDKQVIDYKFSAPDMKANREALREAGLLPTPADGNGIVFVAFSPANPNAAKYAELLSTETMAMRKSGELKEILDRYGVQDFDTATEVPTAP